MSNLSDCVHVPDISLAQSMVRGFDCFTKAFSVVLVVINLPLPCRKSNTIPMHINLKVCFYR